MESFKKWGTRLFLILLFGMSVYGAGRLYFHFTDGFTIGNISSDFPYDPAREVHLLSADQKNLVDSILSQRFTYLGKGCQSYVFLSQDGQYVLKFFKYQRFRTQPWLDYLSFIPWVERYRQEKIAKKQRRLNGFFNSWRIAFDELQEHTGLLYVHLNKTNHLNKVLTITDKMGFEHYLELDQMEFLLQKKVQMLGPYIKELMRLVFGLHLVKLVTDDDVQFFFKKLSQLRIFFTKPFAETEGLCEEFLLIDGRFFNFVTTEKLAHIYVYGLSIDNSCILH